MSASHPSEAEGRTPSPDLCMINQLVDGSWKCYTHDAGASRCALAVRSPAPSDGYLSPELEREYQSIVASHYEDIPPAAPSVEARDADRESIAQTLWIGFGLHVEKLGFHNDPESALRAASLIAQYAALLPPETT